MQFIKINSISCENIIQIFKIFIMLMKIFARLQRDFDLHALRVFFSEEECKYIFNNTF